MMPFSCAASTASGDLPREFVQRLLHRNRPRAQITVGAVRPVDKLATRGRAVAVRLFEAVDGTDVRVIERGEQVALRA
jgi:hypothetical protein